MALIKLQLPAGQATPAPPVGPVLGQHGVNMMEFIKAYNEKTADRMGEIVPVEITVFQDRSFTFITKVAPASALVKQAAKLDKGSGMGRKEIVGRITRDQLREIAEKKLPDLNTDDVEMAMRTLQGTARNMGVVVVD
ncbi:MAG: 50S ribosomal protein L11 [Armatimonadia bacterium]|jgi:large subunit ribosomal protein L11|nr:50S ribosomal protein L11 [Armatimonadia bacterium]